MINLENKCRGSSQGSEFLSNSLNYRSSWSVMLVERPNASKRGEKKREKKLYETSTRRKKHDKKSKRDAKRGKVCGRASD